MCFQYEAEHNISSLLTPLLAILDTTDKLKLTDTIRFVCRLRTIASLVLGAMMLCLAMEMWQF